MIVQSAPADPAREDEFNRWYSEIHLPEIRAVPGFVAARRYRVHTPGAVEDPSGQPYLAIYEIEADDLTAPLAQLRARAGAGPRSGNDVVSTNPPPVVRIYELVEE
jgi:hypothetical protein